MHMISPSMLIPALTELRPTELLYIWHLLLAPLPHLLKPRGIYAPFCPLHAVTAAYSAAPHIRLYNRRNVTFGHFISPGVFCLNLVPRYSM